MSFRLPILPTPLSLSLGKTDPWEPKLEVLMDRDSTSDTYYTASQGQAFLKRILPAVQSQSCSFTHSLYLSSLSQAQAKQLILPNLQICVWHFKIRWPQMGHICVLSWNLKILIQINAYAGHLLIHGRNFWSAQSLIVPALTFPHGHRNVWGPESLRFLLLYVS